MLTAGRLLHARLVWRCTIHKQNVISGNQAIQGTLIRGCATGVDDDVGLHSAADSHGGVCNQCTNWQRYLMISRRANVGTCTHTDGKTWETV
jgi:hypothetical protein